MSFINKALVGDLNCEPVDFEFFLKLLNMGDVSKDQIRIILAEAKKMPAALGGYHGDYDGGLYDHILLVTNIVFQICNNINFLKEHRDWIRKEQIKTSENYNEIDTAKAIQTAIYHDFGKIPYYAFKLGLQNRRIYTNKAQIRQASFDIAEKFNYVGKDLHVDECIAVLKRYNLPFDDEMLQAIIFHHGKWSRYKPYEPTKLSELIHLADMIASRVYEI